MKRLTPMMSPAPGQSLPPRKDRRELAREKARALREEQQKRQRRRRLAWRGGVAVAILAVAAIVAIVIVNGVRPAAAAGPRNMASDGILLTGGGTSVTAVSTPALAAGEKPVATRPSAAAGTVNIVMYVDYLCPYCGQFETTNAAQINSWVTAGNASLELHPISILDSSSAGTKYSTRAANAAACVANFDPDHFLAVHTALFAQQPAENAPGLTDAELAKLVTGAGVTDAKVPGCITDQTFAPWVHAATDRALAGPLPNTDVKKVTGTPTVLVNGKAYSGPLGDAAAFATFVQTQASAGVTGATPIPTATPTPAG
jgi:protein-disulfide isomerase